MKRITHHASRIRRYLFDDYYRLLLIIAVALYVIIFTGLAFDLHAGMRTHKADLGQMDQALWNTSRFRFVEQIQNDYLSTRLTDHVEPIFALIAPALWVWNDVRALLLVQVLAVAAGAFPLYGLALEKLDQLVPREKRRKIWHREPLQQMTRPIALAVAFCYLLAPQLQSAVLTEFHAIPFALRPLILWSLWAVEKKRWGQFALATLLVASVKEEAALLAAGLGAWAVWRLTIEAMKRRGDEVGNDLASASSHHRLIAPLTIAGLVTIFSFVWFYLTTFVIVPSYAVEVYDVAESSYFQRYGALGSSPVDIFLSFFTQPGLVWQIATEPARLDYLWGLIMPFGLLALLAPDLILIALPVLLANQLSAYPAQYYGEFHYSAPILPYFAAAAAYGTARLWRFLAARFQAESGSFQHMSAASAPVMALASLFTNSQNAIRPLIATGLALWLLSWGGLAYVDAGRGPLGGRYDPTPVTEHHGLLPGFVAQIPTDAAVSATAAVHPHVSHRRFVYQFPWGVEAADGTVTDLADWALLDVTSNTDMAPGDLKFAVERMLDRGWGVVDAADGFLLLAKGQGDGEIPAAFYSFVRVDDRRTDDQGTDDRRINVSTHQRLTFGPLTLTAVDVLDWPRWRQSKVTTFWRVEEGYQPGTVRPWVAMMTPGGETILTNEQLPSPGLVWYPPDRWQPGDLIRLESLWLFPPGAFGVVAGVVHGPDANAPGDRLPVSGAAMTDRSGTLGLAATFVRQTDSTLIALPVSNPELSATVAIVEPEADATRGTFGDEEGVSVTGWLSAQARVGQPLNLWLSWQDGPPDLWQTYSVFVHLRRDGQTVAQADGLPRFGLSQAGRAGAVPDWRQIALPPNLAPGSYDVMVGLFDPVSGQRLAAFDARGRPHGDELLIGQVEIRPPLVPDQTCALIPLTCVSQRE